MGRNAGEGARYDGPMGKGRIEKLRAWRTVKDRDCTIGVEVAKVAGEARRLARARGTAGKGWTEVVPPLLAEVAFVEGVSKSGVMTIRAQDAGARFEVARWLRGGGEALLVRACPGVKRVSVV